MYKGAKGDMVFLVCHNALVIHELHINHILITYYCFPFGYWMWLFLSAFQ